MADTDLAFASATEQRRLIASKEVSPVELVNLYFSRTRKLDSQLNSYLTLAEDQALADAKAAEEAVTRGDDLGPLHGVPISVKDLEMTKGLRTTGGSLVFKDRVPEADSAVVERVRRAGAIILGKTNTPEFGLLGHTQNRLGDHCRNPWNTERTTGGSSGGAGAAVAAGLCALATGSDGGGSIRIPSSFCGVYGIKPSQGRVPRFPGAPAPAAANQTSQSGPMSRTVSDSALLLQVLAGHDPRDVVSLRDKPEDYVAAAGRGVKGLKIGWSPDFGYAVVDREVRRVTERAARSFEELGCTVEEAQVTIESEYEAFMPIFTSNAFVASGGLLEDHHDELTDYTLDMLDEGAEVTGAQYSASLGRVDRMKAHFADLFERYDLILSPAVAIPPFPVGDPPTKIEGVEVDAFWSYVQFTAAINLTGSPAASVPCGFTSEDLPVGLHIIGRPRDEATIIAASAAFEEAHPWGDRRPPVS